MKRFAGICTVAVPLVALFTLPAFADVKTRARTQIKFEGLLGRMFGLFGGKAAKEGIEGITAVKGDRESTINDATGRIVDLKEEKVYDLDMKKKTYTVTTFDELRQQMRKAEEDARKNAEKEKPGEKQSGQPAKEMEVDVDVKDTGQKKQAAGYDAHESIVTITVREKGKTLEEGGGVVMTSDIWLGPEIPQMKEMAEFDARYWKQLEGPQATALSAQQMAAMMALYPMLKNAMERMQTEGSKIQGTALETTTTFEGVKSKEDMDKESQSNSGSGIGSMLSRKIMKKDDTKSRATILTLHHEILEVSTSVAASDLAVPADFKEKR